MALFIRKSGILTTVQDLGRFGARRLGVNPTGPMDPVAVRSINIALGNDEKAPVLEMHFPAPEIEFLHDTALCLGGADFQGSVDGDPIQTWTSYFANRGQVLSFKNKIFGNRAYLAVGGGISTREWLGSSSTNLLAGFGGFEGRALLARDVLECAESRTITSITIGRSLIPRYSRFPTLRVVPSGEFDILTSVSERAFENEQFTLTNHSNRMGFRLKGETLHLLQPIELVSSSTSFGTIQLLPDGQLIVLMADHQTAGGYPRIANVIFADLPIAGQLGPGDRVSFKVVSAREAEEARLRFERDLRFFKVGLSLQSNA